MSEGINETVKDLLKPISMTRIELLRVIMVVSALGAACAIISATVGVLLILGGAIVGAITVYNAVIGNKEKTTTRAEAAQDERADS